MNRKAKSLALLGLGSAIVLGLLSWRFLLFSSDPQDIHSQPTATIPWSTPDQRSILRIHSLKDLADLTTSGEAEEIEQLRLQFRYHEGATRDLVENGASLEVSSLLRHWTSLKALYILLPGFTDEGLVGVGTLDNLEHLSLVNTNITDSGLKHISNLSRLRELNLHRTSVTDTGLYHLRDLHSLRRLALNPTTITQQGIDYIQGVLPQCEVIPNVARSTPTQPTQDEPIS